MIIDFVFGVRGIEDRLFHKKSFLLGCSFLKINCPTFDIDFLGHDLGYLEGGRHVTSSALNIWHEV